MNQRTHNFITAALAFLSLVISGAALYVSWSQHDSDYDRAVLVQPGALPLSTVNEGSMPVELEVANTSKTNLQYFLRAHTNMGCIKGINGRPLFMPCDYESQVISLSKSDVGKNSFRHTLTLDAHAGAVKTHPLAYISAPDYFLTIEIIDASNGRNLYKSECFYVYHIDERVFGLYQPVIDTTGESEKRQRMCRP
ncbi:hypothetical protein CVS48_16410 [Achromobacter spanius]|uniref:hypothetical protein n=1 Tax=Achromobacter spanius TaxID=217203 RepID=UPI000C2C7F01|nr:hypothetical protein [Achromobacter spanius]AUA57459.1 hypothetical protein CVS48_16410 [Achromobacter spanius]